MERSAIISRTGITKRFAKQLVLDNVDFEILKGETIIVCGANGSGKTTLLDIVSGIMYDDNGCITPESDRSRISYLTSSSEFFEDEKTGFVLSFAEDAYSYTDQNVSKVEKAKLIEFFEVKPLLGKHFKDLSQGEKNRVKTVACFMKDTDIYILDEPFSNLDIRFTTRLASFMKSKKEHGSTIVLVTHQTESIQDHFDTLVLVESGKITTLKRHELPNRNLHKYIVGRLGLEVSNI